MSDQLALGFLFERTTRVIKLKFHHLFKGAGYTITPEQWVVIDILNEYGKLSQKEIAKLSFKDAPSISRILNGLFSKAYIEKRISDKDKRTSSICLTKKGISVFDSLNPKVKELRSQGVDGISSEDIKELKELMNKVFENYNSN